jgi:hypothetical protein
MPWADAGAERKTADELNWSATAGAHADAGPGHDGGESEEQRAERERHEQGYREGERKKGLLRKLHLH